VLSSLSQSISLGRAFVCPKGSCPPLRKAWADSWVRRKVPACPCFAVELSVSLKTEPTRCYVLHYCVANNPSNLTAGITFSHMLHFFRYSFVLPVFPHRSQTFDSQFMLISILISLITFTTPGLKGASWHHVPSTRASTSPLLPPMAQVSP